MQMSPSEAHDSAYNRTPEHDQMVVDVYEFIKREGCPFRPVFSPDYTKETRDYDNADVECEKMYVGNRTIFADVAVMRWADVPHGSGTKRHFHHLILEIKPQIYSAGATLRQIKAQQFHINKWCEEFEENSRSLIRDKAWATVAPIFKHDDPLIDLFSRMIEPSQTYFVWRDGSLKRADRTSSRPRAAA